MQIRCMQVDHRNQQIIGFCIDSECQNQRPYCHFCLPLHSQHLNKLTSYELLSEWMKEKILTIQYVQKNVQECRIALDNLINVFLPYSNFNLQQFPELGLSQIGYLINGLCQMEDCEENLFNQLKQSIEQIKLIVNEILKKIKNQINPKDNDNLKIAQINIDKQILEQLNYQCIQKPNLKQVNFELIKENSIKQNQICDAIAFNKDYSIVIAGYSRFINIFQHKQGKLNQIQQLNEHTKYVYTLNFMKTTNNFVSGSSDNSIIIWQENGMEWKCQQKLNGHSSEIYCLFLNNTDDLIISGSVDSTIKFWMKQDQWLCSQTITDHNHKVYSLCLNEQQNKLISCSADQTILIIEQQQLYKQWCVIQKIKVDQFGYRLCFICDNQFAFQPYCKEQMDIYEMDSNTKQYKKSKSIAVKCGSKSDNCFFPQQYLNSKCLLLNKNGKNINLIRKKENGDFIIQQSIEFSDHNIFGQLSDDGEYLVTWDKDSKEVQIRKCREL